MLEIKNFLKELLNINLDEEIWDKDYFITKTEEFLNFYKIDSSDIIKNKNLRDKFLEYILNHYSSFFRDYEDFKFLRQIKSSKRVLSIGCSSGEEVYSIGIIFYENNILEKSFILGIDLENIIKKAKEAKWPISFFEEFERNYKLSGGQRNFKDYFIFKNDEFILKDFIRKKIKLKSYDLRNFSFLGKFDLIFFKNVSIYFDDKFLKRVYNWINQLLTPNGYLFLGEDEVKSDYIHIKNNIYQKKENDK